MTARIMQIWITGQKTMNAIRRRDTANFLGLYRHHKMLFCAKTDT